MGLFKLAEMFVEVSASTKQVDGKLAGLKARLGEAAASWGRLGPGAGFAVATTGVAALAVGLGKAVVSAGSLNETLSKVDQVFGDASGLVKAMADEMANAFGSPKGQMLDAAAGIGLIAKAAKMGDEEAAKLSVGFARLADDVTSFYDIPLDVALEKIRSGLVGEAEPMRALGVLLDEDSVKAEAFASGIAKTGAELTQAQKVMARAALITKGLSKAQGDHARTIDSFNNRLREMWGRVSNAADVIGAKLLPGVTSLTNLFVQGGKDIAASLDDPNSEVSKLAGSVNTFFEDLKKSLEENKGQFKGWAQRAVADAKEVAEALSGVAKNAGSLIAGANGVHQFVKSLPGPDDLGLAINRLAKVGIAGVRDFATAPRMPAQRPDFGGLLPIQGPPITLAKFAKDAAGVGGRLPFDIDAIGRDLAAGVAARKIGRVASNPLVGDAAANFKDGLRGMLGGQPGALSGALAKTMADALGRAHASGLVNVPPGLLRGVNAAAGGINGGGMLGGMLGVAGMLPRKKERRGAEFLDNDSLARGLSTAALDSKDDLAKQQIKATEKVVEAVENRQKAEQKVFEYWDEQIRLNEQSVKEQQKQGEAMQEFLRQGKKPLRATFGK